MEGIGDGQLPDTTGYGDYLEEHDMYVVCMSCGSSHIVVYGNNDICGQCAAMNYTKVIFGNGAFPEGGKE
jgi:hypothetical protein